jgi:hypothetical protein
MPRTATPRISVIMPVFNGEQFIEEAVESVLQQTFADLELIVVDDGSTDRTSLILGELAARDERVVVLRRASPGQSAARNAGIDAARAPVLAFLDGDDVALPDRLQRQHAFLTANPYVAVVGGGLHVMDEAGRVFDEIECPTGDAAIRDVLPQHNPMAHTTVMVRKEVFDRVGGYRPAFVGAEDYDLWLRVAEQFQLANLPGPVCHYRVHPSQTTVIELESQSLAVLGAAAAARARATSGSDPFDSIDHITSERLLALDVNAADVTVELVQRACGIANRLDLAGYTDLADNLFEVAAKQARSSTGTPHLVAVVHRARAERHGSHGRTLRASLERGRAAIADRAEVNPVSVVARALRSAVRSRPARRSAHLEEDDGASDHASE